MGLDKARIGFVVGMMLYWQAIINQIFPPSLMGFDNSGFAPRADYSIGTFIVILIAGVIYALFEKRMLRFFCNALCVALLLILFLISLVSFSFIDRVDSAYKAAYTANFILYALLLFGLTVSWGRIASSFSMRRLLIDVPLSMVCTVVLASAGSYILELFGISNSYMQMLCPILSGACLVVMLNTSYCSRSPMGELSIVTIVKNGDSQLMACAILTLYLFFTSIYWSVNTEGMGPAISAIMDDSSHKIALLLLTVLFYIVMKKNPNALSNYPYFIIFFISICIGALYLVALFWESSSWLCSAVVLPTRAFSIFLFWVLLLDFCKRRSISFSTIVAVLFLPIVSITWIVAYLFYKFWGELASEVSPEVLILVLVLTAAFILMLATFQYIGSQRNETISIKRSRLLSAASDEVERTGVYNQFKDLYGLTDRETDVLVLICEGNTKKRIAELLGVSVSSVQTYSKGLYSKVGIHSKQELIDMVRDSEC